MPKRPEQEPGSLLPSFSPPPPGEPKSDDYEYYSRRRKQREDSIDRFDDQYRATDKEQFEFNVLDAKDALRSRFGIEHLSLIEHWHLRKIVEQCIVEDKKYRALTEQGKVEGHDTFGVVAEAVARWFRDLYNIDIQLMNEVEQKENKSGTDVDYTQEFKDSIRILREKAHYNQL